MKLKFTRKTWYFFLLAAAAVSMLGGFAVLGGMDFSGLEMIVFCLTGIAVLFLAAQKGAPAREKRNWCGLLCWQRSMSAADPSSGSCSW